MINIRSIVPVCDNSGVKKIRCIRVLTKSQKNNAVAGNHLVGSAIRVKKSHRKGVKKQLKQGDIVKTLLVNARTSWKRPGSAFLKVKKLGSIVLNPNGLPKGTRVKLMIPREVKKKNSNRLLTISKGFF